MLDKSFQEEVIEELKELKKIKDILIKMSKSQKRPLTLNQVLSFFDVIQSDMSQGIIVFQYDSDDRLFSITRENDSTLYVKYRDETGIDGKWENNWSKIKDNLGSMKKGLLYVMENY